MSHELDAIQAQMNRLERQLYVFKILAVVLAVLALVTALAPQPAAQQTDTVRARQLVIEDAQGRSRVVLGLDAPPGPGFLDRRTSVVSRMHLDEQNRAWLRFLDFSQTPAVLPRYGLTGEEVLRPPPQ